MPDTVPELVDMFGHYRNGFLWFDGAMSQQPPFYAEAMALISNVTNELMENQAKADAKWHSATASASPPRSIAKRPRKGGA